jgi:hypothetical protein
MRAAIGNCVWRSTISMLLIVSPGARSRSGSRKRMLLTISMPLLTRPKTECLPVRCGVGTKVMKNCEPCGLRPAFVMVRTPGRPA